MQRILFLLISAALVSPIVLPVAAQSAQISCDERIKPVEGSLLGYSPRGNRCEGLYASEVGSTFEVVYFLLSTIHFPWGDDVVLHVSSPLDQRDAVNVRAVALPLGTYYRMDALLPLDWPVADVLYPQGLNSEKLGVYAWMNRASEKVYVPVNIVPQGTVHPKEKSSLQLGIRPTSAMRAVFWRTMSVVGGECGGLISEWKQVGSARADVDGSDYVFRRGDVVRIDLSGAPEGEICLEISADEAQAPYGRVNLKYRVFVP